MPEHCSSAEGSKRFSSASVLGFFPGPHAPVVVLPPQAGLSMAARECAAVELAVLRGLILNQERGQVYYGLEPHEGGCAGRVARSRTAACCGSSDGGCCGSRIWLGPLGGIDIM